MIRFVLVAALLAPAVAFADAPGGRDPNWPC